MSTPQTHPQRQSSGFHHVWLSLVTAAVALWCLFVSLGLMMVFEKPTGPSDGGLSKVFGYAYLIICGLAALIFLGFQVRKMARRRRQSH